MDCLRLTHPDSCPSVFNRGLNTPHVSAVPHRVSPPPLLSDLLPILLTAPHHRVQLWPSQGAVAGAHLTGPWPQDDSQQQHVPYMRDKATQVSLRGTLFVSGIRYPELKTE